MFCTNCGKQLEDGSTVCRYCGAKLSYAGETTESEAVEPIEATPQAKQTPDEDSAGCTEATAVPDSTGGSAAGSVSTVISPTPEPIITGKKRRGGVLIGAVAVAAAMAIAVILVFSGIFPVRESNWKRLSLSL